MLTYPATASAINHQDIYVPRPPRPARPRSRLIRVRENKIINKNLHKMVSNSIPIGIGQAASSNGAVAHYSVVCEASHQISG